MKSNGTRFLLIVVFLQLLILIFSFSTKAQPDYTFAKPVLLSGTDLAVGAKYRFSAVKPGVDGILTIVDMKGKMTLKELDGPSGFDEAFQPYINCEPKSKGYVEFLIEFVSAGTTKLLIQKEVPLTAIDIDGYEFPDNKLFETDGFEESSSFYIDYDMLGTSLEVKKTGNWVEAINQSAITYDGIDTVQKDVMFTAVHANVSSVRFRVGADNQSKEFMYRLRSIYFKKFIYSNSFLPKSPLLSFNGVEKSNKVNLSWTIENNNLFKSFSIEKGKSSSSFIEIGKINGVAEVSAQSNFSFADQELLTETSFYRLKMVGINGQITYSAVLVFRGKHQGSSSFKIFPSVIQGNATISVTAASSGTATLDIVDYSGRLINRRQLQVLEGTNNIVLNNTNSILSGNYFAVLKIDKTTYSQKIIKK